MFASLLFLVVQSIISVSATTSSSDPPLFWTVGEAKYRISTAKLTIHIPTRKFLKQFALTEDVELDLGRPNLSLVREVQSTLAPLVIAETKWNSTGVGPSSRIRSDKIDRLVRQLSEMFKSWPGVLIDQFVHGAIKDFDETVESVRNDFDELNQITEELMNKRNKRNNWNSKEIDQLYLLDELYNLLKPAESSIKHFHSTLLIYLKYVKHLWKTDRIPNSNYAQKHLTKALWGVKFRVANYHKIKSTMYWQICVRLIVLSVSTIPLAIVFVCLIGWPFCLGVKKFLRRMPVRDTRRARTTTRERNFEPRGRP